MNTITMPGNGPHHPVVSSEAWLPSVAVWRPAVAALPPAFIFPPTASAS